MDNDNRLNLTPLDEYPIDKMDTEEKRNSRHLDYDSFRFTDNDLLKKYLMSGYDLYRQRSFDSNDSIILIQDYGTPDSSLFVNSKDGFYYSVLAMMFSSSCEYSHNRIVKDIIDKRPDICVTKLDAALLGCIYMILHNVTADYDNDHAIHYSSLIIRFWNNALKYQLEEKKTIDYENSDATGLFNLLAFDDRSSDGLRLIPLTDLELKKIQQVADYKKELNALIDSELAKERNYINDQENRLIWEESLRLFNYRIEEENRILYR